MLIANGPCQNLVGRYSGEVATNAATIWSICHHTFVTTAYHVQVPIFYMSKSPSSHKNVMGQDAMVNTSTMFFTIKSPSSHKNVMGQDTMVNTSTMFLTIKSPSSHKNVMGQVAIVTTTQMVFIPVLLV